MPTVVNPNRQDISQQRQMNQQSQQGLQEVLEMMNQRKHQVEQQQREAQYNFMNQYAASHGGWANVLAQPGGEDFVGEYMTNVLGYGDDVVPGAMEAIKKGFNPDEAAYAIRQNNMFGVQGQQQDEVRKHRFCTGG